MSKGLAGSAAYEKRTSYSFFWFFHQFNRLTAALAQPRNCRSDRANIAVVIELMHLAIFHRMQIAGHLKGSFVRNNLPLQKKHFGMQVCIKEQGLGRRGSQ